MNFSFRIQKILHILTAYLWNKLPDLFIGGTDTTSATMEWAMAELLHNPDKMAKAKQELNQKIGLSELEREREREGDDLLPPKLGLCRSWRCRLRRRRDLFADEMSPEAFGWT